MAKIPKWQSALEHLSDNFRPWRFKLAPLAVPAYVHRWLCDMSRGSPTETGIDPDRLAADIVREACLNYFRVYAPPLPFQVIGCQHVRPPDRSKAMVAGLASAFKGGAVVFNGSFAWSFALDRTTDKDRFLAWVKQAFSLPEADLTMKGWPVVLITTGQWPLDVRLLPGSPVAVPELDDPEMIEAGVSDEPGAGLDLGLDKIESDDIPF